MKLREALEQIETNENLEADVDLDYSGDMEAQKIIIKFREVLNGL